MENKKVAKKSTNSNKNNSKSKQVNKNNNIKSNNSKNSSNKNKTLKVAEPIKKSNKFIMSFLIVLGVLILGFIIIYLMNYFFVERINLKVNISTDKKLEYITVAGNEELVSTQKYVSDLSYSMRYDINKFSVFKDKTQDIYKFLKDDRVLLVVEKSELPKNCTSSDLDLEYNNCIVNIDDYTSNYYITKDNVTYKITIKSLNVTDLKDEAEPKINYMLNNFEITV